MDTIRYRSVLRRNKLNGRLTYWNTDMLVRGIDVAKNGYEAAKPQTTQGNTWSSTENNSNNAWNVNFNDGNTNNNNKYNSNTVRPVAALGYDSSLEDMLRLQEYSDSCRKAVPQDFYQSVVTAYEICKAGKTSSSECLEYMNRAEVDLPILAYELWTDTYEPTVSTCFLVRYPKLREVFAANFRDRIVHHWISNYVNHLFEQRFISQGNVSFNCRKGYGTDKAVEAVAEGMRKVTYNYQKEAWVFRGDLVGFFMSIDKNVMWRLMERFLNRRLKNVKYKEIILRVVKIVIYHRPEKNCVFNSDYKLWEGLPANKSLLRNPPDKGMPIGNLTTQLFANFYMSFFDMYVQCRMRRLNYSYTRFVDDFVIVCDDKRAMLDLIPDFGRFLWDILKVRLHHAKHYCQPASHGVLFVGTYIKYGRLYLSNRTLARMEERIHGFREFAEGKDELTTADCARIQCVMNSYFGFCNRRRTYKRRRRMLAQFGCGRFWRYFYVKGDCKAIEVRDKYKPFKLSED